MATLLQNKKALMIGSGLSILAIFIIVGIIVVIVKFSGVISQSSTTGSNVTTTPSTTNTTSSVDEPNSGRRPPRPPNPNATASAEFKPLFDVDDIKDANSAAIAIIITAQQLEDLVSAKKKANKKVRDAASKHFKLIADKVIKTVSKNSSIAQNVHEAIKQLAERPCLPKTVDTSATLAWKVDQPPCDGPFIRNNLKDLLSSPSVTQSKEALSILEKHFKEEPLLQPDTFSDLCEKLVSVQKQLDDCLPSSSTSTSTPKLSAKQQRQLQKVLCLFTFLKENDILSLKEDELNDIDINAFFAAKILSSSPIFSKTSKFLIDSKKTNLPIVLKSIINLFGEKGQDIFILNAGAARQLYACLRSTLNEASNKVLLLGLGAEKMFLEIMHDFSKDPKTYSKLLCDLKIDLLPERFVPNMENCTQRHHLRPDYVPESPASSPHHAPCKEFRPLDSSRQLPLNKLPLVQIPKPDASKSETDTFDENIKIVRRKVGELLENKSLEEYVPSSLDITYSEKDQYKWNESNPDLQTTTTGIFSLVKALFNIISYDLAYNFKTDLLASPDTVKKGGMLPLATMDPGTMRHLALMHGKLSQVGSRIPFTWNEDYLRLIFAPDVNALINISERIVTKYSKTLSLNRINYDYPDVNTYTSNRQLASVTLTDSKEFIAPIGLNAESKAHWQYIRQEMILEAGHRLALGAILYLEYFLAFVKEAHRSNITMEYFIEKCSPLVLDARQLADKCLSFESGKEFPDLHIKPLIKGTDKDGAERMFTPEEAVRDVIGRLDEEKAHDFLMYVTGSQELPPTGYDNQFILVNCLEYVDDKEVIKRNMLPTASTCYNTLTFYMCNTVEDFEKNLKVVLSMTGLYGGG